MTRVAKTWRLPLEKSDQEPGSVIDCIQGMRGEFKAQINEISTTVQEIKSKIVAVNNTISAIQKSKAEMEEVQQKTSTAGRSR